MGWGLGLGVRRSAAWVGVAALGLAVLPGVVGAAAGATAGTPGSGMPGRVESVSADSSRDAWAVGFVGDAMFPPQQALILHWNGKGWTTVISPNPGGPNGTTYLFGVSAVSPTDAWAVGDYRDAATGIWNTLVLRWNGSVWAQVPSPNPGGGSPGRGSFLSSVSADSKSDAWAVGGYQDPSSGNTFSLVLHWNGTSWAQVASPSPGGNVFPAGSDLSSVSAVSPSDAWTVGHFGDPTSHAVQTLVEHWDGTRWTVEPSPDPGGNSTSDQESTLSGVSSQPRSAPMAVGSFRTSVQSPAQTLAIGETPTGWVQEATPNPGGTASGGDELLGVSVVSAREAWAVGDYSTTTSSAPQQLVLRWDGTTWTQMASPEVGTGTNFLFSVASLSAKEAWAAGSYYDQSTGTSRTLLIHWNGKAWTES